MASCPICCKPSAPRADNRSFPFCRPRCKQIDLGQWLLEAYRVPSTEQPGTDDDASFINAHGSQELE